MAVQLGKSSPLSPCMQLEYKNILDAGGALKLSLFLRYLQRPTLLGEALGHPFRIHGNGRFSTEERRARSCACSKSTVDSS